MARQTNHARWSSPRPHCVVYGSSRRYQTQCSYQNLLSSPASCRQSEDGGVDRLHAQVTSHPQRHVPKSNLLAPARARFRSLTKRQLLLSVVCFADFGASLFRVRRSSTYETHYHTTHRGLRQSEFSTGV